MAGNGGTGPGIGAGQNPNNPYSPDQVAYLAAAAAAAEHQALYAVAVSHFRVNSLLMFSVSISTRLRIKARISQIPK